MFGTAHKLIMQVVRRGSGTVLLIKLCVCVPYWLLMRSEVIVNRMLGGIDIFLITVWVIICIMFKQVSGSGRYKFVLLISVILALFFYDSTYNLLVKDL